MMTASSSALSYDWFWPILIGSVLLHFIFITYVKLVDPRSEFSVEQAPNTISIAIIKTIPKKKKIVEQELLKPLTQENTENNVEVQIMKKIIEEKTPVIEREEVVQETVLAKESAGALEEAKPLEHINPAPSYPNIAKRQGWEGTVLLKVWVSANGLVDQVEIKESSGFASLDRSAVKTVKKWQFKPAERNLIGISSNLMVPIEFKLINL